MVLWSDSGAMTMKPRLEASPCHAPMTSRRPATLVVKQNDDRQWRRGIGRGRNLIAVVALLAVEGEGVVLDFVLALRAGGQHGKQREEKQERRSGPRFIDVGLRSVGSEHILTKRAGGAKSDAGGAGTRDQPPSSGKAVSAAEPLQSRNEGSGPGMVNLFRRKREDEGRGRPDAADWTADSAALQRVGGAAEASARGTGQRAAGAGHRADVAAEHQLSDGNGP